MPTTSSIRNRLARSSTGWALSPNLGLFAYSARSAGFLNFVPDSDGTFRRAPLIIRYATRIGTQLEENFYPSLAAQTVCEYLNATPQDVIFWFNVNGPERLEIGPYTIVPDVSGQVLINYAGPAESYRHYSFSAVEEGVVPPETFKDKIVLIGATAIGIGDMRNVPYEKQKLSRSGDPRQHY